MKQAQQAASSRRQEDAGRKKLKRMNEDMTCFLEGGQTK